jgi:hypothetical protein
MTLPALVAFMATPGMEDEVRGSPGSMTPFSLDTLTGTLPFKAIGYMPGCHSPII